MTQTESVSSSQLLLQYLFALEEMAVEGQRLTAERPRALGLCTESELADV